MIVSTSFNTSNQAMGMLVHLTIPTFFSLYLVPRILYKIYFKRYIDIVRKEVSIKSYIPLLFFYIMFIIFYYFKFINKFDSNIILFSTIFHFYIVALGEEFIYRSLLINLLNKKFSTKMSLLISSILFAFILHINENIIVNMFIRLPLGIIFGIISIKDNSIKYPILLHTVYNLILFII
ncbi:CPBP family intramembrane glutamic endopeptidase [Paraclostridium bifermentans]|uniref:CPBP family intramembrane glutamic endopeptidase n=1 Tax=Paraclostridium bifermentans TaxID=1490 RepID=UPI003A7F5885